jgi:hypothetical protein
MFAMMVLLYVATLGYYSRAARCPYACQTYGFGCFQHQVQQVSGVIVLIIVTTSLSGSSTRASRRST